MGGTSRSLFIERIHTLAFRHIFETHLVERQLEVVTLEEEGVGADVELARPAGVRLQREGDRESLGVDLLVLQVIEGKLLLLPLEADH